MDSKASYGFFPIPSLCQYLFCFYEFTQFRLISEAVTPSTKTIVP